MVDESFTEIDELLKDVNNASNMTAPNEVGENLRAMPDSLDTTKFRAIRHPTDASQLTSGQSGKSIVPSALKSSLQATAVRDGVLTRRLRGMMTVIPFSVRVPPERMSAGSSSVALKAIGNEI